MSSGTGSHRAVTVGLCGALGVLVPLAAYAVSMPYDAVHEVVAAGAAPFAVGAVAGVGTLAISMHVSDRRAAKRAAKALDEPEVEEDAEAEDAARAEASERADGASSKKRSKQERDEVVKGVPVISRAPGAMTEEEAWAEIDAMMGDDERISCDPEHAEDLYQIALEELARTQAEGSSASPYTTAQYVALAMNAAPSAAGSVPTPVVEGVAAAEPAAEHEASAAGLDSTDVYVKLAEQMNAAKAAAKAGAAPSEDEEGEPEAGITAELDSTDVYLSLVIDADAKPAAGTSAPAASAVAPDATSVYLSLVEDAAPATQAEAAQDEPASAAAASAGIDELLAELEEPEPLAGVAASKEDSDERLPDATAVYMALVKEGANVPADASQADITAEIDSGALDEDTLCTAAREAALTALYGTDRLESDRAKANQQPFDVIGVPASDEELVAELEAEPAAAASGEGPSREDIWAQAIAILEEDETVEEEVPRPHGAHFASTITVEDVEHAMEEQGMREPESFQYAVAARIATAAPTTDGSDELDPGRVAAVAEGARETAMHERVNEILEEEFEKIPSESVRRTSREYLRVIEGGTVLMPELQDDREKLQAEA